MLLLHIGLDAVEKFLHIGEPGLTLHGSIGLVKEVNAAFRGQGHGYVIGIPLRSLCCCFAHHGAECLYFADSRSLKAERLQIGQRRCLIQRHTRCLCCGDKGVQGCVADASCGLIDNTLKRLIVIEIHG